MTTDRDIALPALSPGDWHRLNQLLESALELEPLQRNAWLSALDGEPAAVLAALRILLLQHAEATTGAASPPPRLLESLMAADAPDFDEVGTEVGPYRILAHLGDGGMASVWRAERADGAVKREVALKIPHARWADRGLHERISRECAVLASLNHPNIAQLYDAGWSASGRPYLALELIDGEAIDVSCDARALDTRARVRLFIDVLQTVAYAHVRLVVHRDLKPSNVMVNRQGQIKLLDFGIAKVLVDQAASGEESDLTRMAGRPLTPAYAAPEQVLGLPVTTATDIYSLGAMLYELLSGERACRPKGSGSAAMEAAIVHADPPAPSSVAREPAAARALRGDLDAIIGKALSKDPERRYETAGAFAEDLERFLAGHAVRARRPSRWYWFSRFVARNRIAVGASTVAVLATLSGLTMALWQARIASLERDSALAAAEHRTAVGEFLSDLLQEGARTGKPVSIGDLIGNAADISAAEFAGSPDLRAAVLKTVGDFKIDVEGYPQAVTYYEQAAQLIGDSQDTGLRATIRCRLAMLRGVGGRVAEARQAIDAVIAEPQTTDFFRSQCLGDLAQMELAIVNNDGVRASVAARRALGYWESSSRRSPMQRLQLMLFLAQADSIGGHPDRADQAFAQIQAELRTLGRDRGNWGTRVRLARADAAISSGDLRSALALLDEIIAMQARDLPNSPPPEAVLTDRNTVLLELGDEPRALAGFNAVAAAAGVEAPLARRDALFNAAVAAARLGRREDASRLFAAATAVETSAPGVHDTAEEIVHLLAQGKIELAEGSYPSCRATLSRAIAMQGLMVETLSVLYRTRAEAALGDSDPAAALADARIALSEARQLQGDRPYSVWTGLAQLTLGRALQASGQGAEANTAYRQAYEQLSRSLGAGHRWSLQALTLLEATDPPRIVAGAPVHPHAREPRM